MTHLSTGAVPLNRFIGSAAAGALSTCTETNHDEESLSTTAAGSTAAHCCRSPGTPKPRLFSIRPAQRSCRDLDSAAVALSEVFLSEGLANVARVHRRAARAVAAMAARRTVVDCLMARCLGWPLHDGDGGEDDGVEPIVGRMLAEQGAGSLKNRPCWADGVGVTLAFAPTPPPQSSSLLVAERVRR